MNFIKERQDEAMSNLRAQLTDWAGDYADDYDIVEASRYLVGEGIYDIDDVDEDVIIYVTDAHSTLPDGI